MIRKITGANITTVAGISGQGPAYGGDGGAATSANFSGPTAVVLDAAGNLYIADTGNSLVRKVGTDGIINTYIGGTGGTLGTAGKLSAPNGLWFDASGALYIADSNNARVARYVPPSNFINFAGNLTANFSGDGGQATRAQLNKPVGVASDAAGNIYIADTNNSRIRKVAADGIITTIAGKGGAAYNGDGGSATAAALNFPRSIAVRSNGTVYIADTGNHVIRTLTPSFPTISTNGVTNAASFATRHFARSAGEYLRYRVRHGDLSGRRRVQLAHQQPGRHQREGEWRGGASLLRLAGTDQLPGAMGHAYDGHRERRGLGERRQQQYRRCGGGNRCSRPVLLCRAVPPSYRIRPVTH